MTPKISVVMPVWNGEKYLRSAIDSVLNQTFSDFELIVVDDGSTDGTREILASYADARMKVHQVEHGGIVIALQTGVAAARAKWIARQDADDISQPERFATQWQAVSDNANAVLCFCDVSLMGEETAKIGRARFPRTKSFIALRLCFECPIVHSSVFFRKETYLQAGGYRPEARHAEDYELWGRLLELGGFISIPQQLLRLRVHGVSTSQQNLAAQSDRALKIGTEHCRRFMSLTPQDATRAVHILRTPARQRKFRDWTWFLTTCAPRLRWKSAEALGWLVWQTVKTILPA